MAARTARSSSGFEAAHYGQWQEGSGQHNVTQRQGTVQGKSYNHGGSGTSPILNRCNILGHGSPPDPVISR